MMPALVDLQRVLEITDGLSANHHDWHSVERVIGSVIPSDYKEMLDSFGGGYVDEYIYLLEPDCRNRHYDLTKSVEERTEALGMLWAEGEAQPAGLEEFGGRLIPWATTDNG